MRIIRLRYLQTKLPHKFNFKALLLAFVASLFLSACGIKGDLYQTPEQPVTETETVEVDDNKAQTEEINKSLESDKQLTEQSEEPVLEPAPKPVKSAQNVS